MNKNKFISHKYIGLAGLILVAFVTGLVFFNQDSALNDEPPEVEDIQNVQASGIIPEGQVRRLSDGVIVPEEDQIEKLYAVMIENSAEAWPLSGLAKARMVFEAPVEGSIPRFMVIFDDKQELEMIGPVRSARPYYIDWVMGLGAMYTHVGGSPEALSMLSNLSVQSLNQFFFSDYFWRSTSRYAPHNVYINSYELGQAYEYKRYEKSELVSYTYRFNDSDSEQIGQKVTIPLSPSGSLYNATWDYDVEQKNYLRYQNNQQQADLDNSEVRASNVVVIKTAISVIDDVGRRKVVTTGEGDGVLFQEGLEIPIKWQKNTRTERLMFFDKNDEELSLLAGPTWIEVIPLSTEVKVEYEEK